MSKPLFTIITPTHSHGETLRYAAKSVQEQSIQSFEHFIILDGANDITKTVASDVAQKDKRIRLFEFNKGPRLGEAYRHNILLNNAQGDLVCYMPDDDMWLPNHLSIMQTLLAMSDFAHTLPIFIDAKGQIQVSTINLELPFYKNELLAGRNRVPLGCFGHTSAYYKKLPYGWRTTPVGTPTDLYMFQQFLQQKDCQFKSGNQPTLLKFGQDLRKGWSDQQRLAEIESWDKKRRQPNFNEFLQKAVLNYLLQEKSRQEPATITHIENLQRQIAALQTGLAAESKTRRALEQTVKNNSLELNRRSSRWFFSMRSTLTKIPGVKALADKKAKFKN